MPASISPCSWWHQSASLLPAKTFVCNGKGSDGWKWDWTGAACPSKYPSTGFYWYGSAIGWAPSASFMLTSWSQLTVIENVDYLLGLWTWWSPPTGLTIPSSITIRPHWPQAAYPSASWSCAGTGLDGKHFNHKGETLPAGYPAGWLWVRCHIAFFSI